LREEKRQRFIECGHHHLTPWSRRSNLAKALLTMSSGENMPDDEGEGIFGVAETLVELLECLQETRVELWRLAGDVAKEGAA
jgi:hypothetical protein